MHDAIKSIGRAGLATTLLIATHASGYLISPRLAVHETMTRMAYDCFARAVTEPKKCWTDPARLDIAKGKFTPEEMAVRWPDDPLRKGDSKLTLASLGKDIVLDCPKQVKDAAGKDKTIYDAGLVCSSHFGRLQFLHAMASAGDRDRKATLRKIFAWSAFTYDVATARIDLDLDICKAVTPAYGGKPVYAALADAFEAAPGNSCDLPPTAKGRERQGFSIRAFFTADCAGKVRLPGKPCGPDIDSGASADSDVLARRAAVGALMHLVQDSYSQSHVARPIDGVAVAYMGPFTATVACTFPVAYFDYGTQAFYQNHSDGDQRPMLDSSCGSGPVADPVTASAVIWWKVSRGRMTAEMLGYLTAHVFGPL
ncbi:MAG: hypothetical protein V4459_08090 [Pseudomonadota bacterium]